LKAPSLPRPYSALGACPLPRHPFSDSVGARSKHREYPFTGGDIPEVVAALIAGDCVHNLPTELEVVLVLELVG
jgi:hypothetical protein